MRLAASLLLLATFVAPTGAAATTRPNHPLSPFQLAELADEIAIVERGRPERILRGTGAQVGDGTRLRRTRPTRVALPRARRTGSPRPTR